MSTPALKEERRIRAILRDLDESVSLPRTAILSARECREEITPRLIEALRDATARAAAGEVVEGSLPFYSLLLLIEFKAKEALPAILEALSLPGDHLDDLFGDAITEFLSRGFAVLVDDVATLDALISDRSIDAFVRGAAADTFPRFVRAGRMPREEAVSKLRRHLRDVIENEDNDFAGLLLSALLDLGPEESEADILEAFEKELVTDGMVDLDDLERCLAQGEAAFTNAMAQLSPDGIDDVIEEVRSWYQPASRGAWHDYPVPDKREESGDDAAPAYACMPVETIRRDGPSVGRNDSCPCGSGKKFKNCCGFG